MSRPFRGKFCIFIPIPIHDFLGNAEMPILLFFILSLFIISSEENIQRVPSSNNLLTLTNTSLLCRFPITGEFYIEEKGRHRVLKIDEAHFESKGDCVKADRRRDFFVDKQQRLF